MRFIIFVLATGFCWQSHAALSIGGGLIRYDNILNNVGKNEPKPTLVVKQEGTIDPRVSLGATFQWSETPEIGAGLTTYSTIASGMLESNYLFDTVHSGLRVGAKIGFVWIESQLRLGGGTYSKDTTWALGLGAQGGYAFELMKGLSVEPELSLLSVRTPEASTLASAVINFIYSW